MSTSEAISQLDTGTPKGTDLTPATDITDLTESPTGTTKKYTRWSELNFYLNGTDPVISRKRLVLSTHFYF